MRLQLLVTSDFICTVGRQVLGFETKHYVFDDQDATVRWYIQIFRVPNPRGVENTVLLFLKRGKATVKKSKVRIDIDGVLTIDTDTDEPIDPVSDAYAAASAKLPQVESWKWQLHREMGPVTTESVYPGISLICNTGADAAVHDTTVQDGFDWSPAQYVRVGSAKWMLVRRGNRVAHVHLWPGASEEIEEIAEAVKSLS
jgi:hypothetical protein